MEQELCKDTVFGFRDLHFSICIRVMGCWGVVCGSILAAF